MNKRATVFYVVVLGILIYFEVNGYFFSVPFFDVFPIQELWMTIFPEFSSVLSWSQTLIILLILIGLISLTFGPSRLGRQKSRIVVDFIDTINDDLLIYEAYKTEYGSQRYAVNISEISAVNFISRKKWMFYLLWAVETVVAVLIVLIFKHYGISQLPLYLKIVFVVFGLYFYTAVLFKLIRFYLRAQLDILLSDGRTNSLFGHVKDFERIRTQLSRRHYSPVSVRSFMHERTWLLSYDNCIEVQRITHFTLFVWIAVFTCAIITTGVFVYAAVKIIENIISLPSLVIFSLYAVVVFSLNSFVNSRKRTFILTRGAHRIGLPHEIGEIFFKEWCALFEK